MDSQSKLILMNDEKDYELELYTADDLKNLTPADIIQVREFSELDMLLEGGDDDYFEMPEMDDYYIPNRVSQDKDGRFKYPANDNFSLFRLRETNQLQVVPLVPGLYTIKSFIGDNQFYSYFYVVPKDLSVPDWQQMKDEVESAVSGLAVDFFRRRNSESVSDNTIDDDSDISMTKIKLFLQREHEIRFVIEKLRKEARYKIGKKYSWEPIGAKNLTDSLTIRKMGERPDKRGMVYSANRYLEYDVPENRWAKIILKNFILFSTRSVKKLEAIKKGLEQDRLSNKKFDYRRNESDVYFQKSRLQTSLETVNDDIEKLSQLASYFHIVLTDDFLDESIGDVNRSIPKALVLNPNYNFLYRLYIILNKKQNEVILDHAYEYFWKRTNDLYEIWTYIKTIQALIENGYRPIEGWIFSKNPYEDVLPRLDSDEVVSFSNPDGNLVRLVFNSVIGKGKKSTKERPLLTDSNRNKPDIRLDMFDSNEEYAGSILLDAKYKRLRKVLRTQEGENGVMEQFREYKKAPYVSKGYWHVDELLQSQLMPVQAVIVLYPKDDGSRIRSQTPDQFIFINELNPHEGLEEFAALLEEQMAYRYEIFKRFYKASEVTVAINDLKQNDEASTVQSFSHLWENVVAGATRKYADQMLVVDNGRGVPKRFEVIRSESPGSLIFIAEGASTPYYLSKEMLKKTILAKQEIEGEREAWGAAGNSNAWQAKEAIYNDYIAPVLADVSDLQEWLES